MSFKYRTYLICTALTWPAWSLMLFVLLRRSRFIESGGTKALIIILGGLILSLLINLVIVVFSKSVRNQNAIMSELETNGYSDKLRELLEEEIERLGNKTINRVYIDYVFKLTNVYLTHRRPQDALYCINRLDIEGLKRHIDIKKDTDRTILWVYFCIQMSICEELGDVNRAHNVFADARPYLDQYSGKGNITDAIALEVYSIYYRILGQYEQSIMCAEQMISQKNRLAKVDGYLLKGYTLALLGDFEQADTYVHESFEQAKSKAEMDIVDSMRGKINDLKI